jgi:hypothetical protein
MRGWQNKRRLFKRYSGEETRNENDVLEVKNAKTGAVEEETSDWNGNGLL